jgi:hypothetical protein
MNEMQLGAGLADHGQVAVLRIIRNVVQPMLHVYVGLRTGEYDVAAHAEK